MSFLVKDAMTHGAITISLDASVDETCAKLQRHNISGLPVVDDKGQIVGIISEADLLEFIVDFEPAPPSIATCVTYDVITISDEDTLVHAVDLLCENRIRRMPVVSGDRLVGILSRRDLIRHVTKLREASSCIARRREHSPSATSIATGSATPVSTT